MSAHSITSRGLAGRKIPQGTLTPMGTLLFSASEPGAWYDPSDLSTLFQDAAGTTPVTAVEQPVGRILDKSGRGNHATQSTTTKRPVLSRRVNLLTNTEDFSNPYWVKASSSVDSNVHIAPDGTLSADAITTTGGATKKIIRSSVFSGASTFSVYIRKINTDPSAFPAIATFNNTGVGRGVLLNPKTGSIGDISGATGDGFSIIAGGNLNADVKSVDDYWKLSISATYAFSVAIFPNFNSTGGSAQEVTETQGTNVFWGASLTLATDAHLPYQWVNTATDYDADPAKFPAYLRFDGVDDALQTANIDFTSTDKMTVWAGVTRFSDSATAVLAELGPNVAINNGSWAMIVPADIAPVMQFVSGGTISSGATKSSNPAPETLRITGYGDIPAPISGLRLNGSTTTSTTTQGEGSYGNYPLYIGGRLGNVRFFNGRLYSLIVRGAQSSLSQIEATELYIKQKMRMP